MDQHSVYQKIWLRCAPIARFLIKASFNIEYDEFPADKTCLVISNHVTGWDPLLVASGAVKHQMYFVASEHLFRKGWVTKLLHSLVGIIARKKGSSGTDTAMACLRHLRKGHSVCIFGEGEVTWDGTTCPTFAGTGTLARASGAHLVTYRLEGGHLTRPRWARGIRRGKMYGRVVNVYSPETLKSMDADEIAAAIDRDIHEDAYERQAKAPVKYKGMKLANRMEAAIFLCPHCKRIGTIRGKNNTIRCSCGYHTDVTAYGTFLPPYPFVNFKEWDHFQHEELTRMYREGNLPVFSDDAAALVEIGENHVQTPLASGMLTLRDGVLSCVNYQFPLSEISQMAIVQTNILLFSHHEKYYEIRTKVGVNLRKYLHIFNLMHENA